MSENILFSSAFALRQWWRCIQMRRQQNKRLLGVFLYDARRYSRFHYRRGCRAPVPEHLQAMMMMEAHAVEKGFCFPQTRLGYGAVRIRLLIQYMDQYRRAGFDRNHFMFRNAQSVLAEYLKYHEKLGYELGSLRDEIRPWATEHSGIGGYKELTREEVLKKAGGNFELCALSRHSIRNFSKEPVPVDLIRDAVRIARKAPSVCNRQSWHVYLIKDPILKEKALALQNGNRGFGHTADFVAVITTDTCAFTGAHERNQPYVDGGLFAMSFIYALHSKGIGICPLNWMVEPPLDRQLRTVVPIKPSEAVIMMIAGGFLPSRLHVPESARTPVENILTII